MKVTLDGQEYELIISHYSNNKRTYFGLESIDGPYSDISENHIEISDDLIRNHLPDHEAVVIDNDFISLFPSEREAKIWIKDNLPQCVITGELEGRPVFYISTVNL